MSVLTLIRHGQASFFDANYDQLSPVGERQMRALGEYWARRHLHFDEVCTGPRVRQERSAQLAVAACRQSFATENLCFSGIQIRAMDEGITSRTRAP